MSTDSTILIGDAREKLAALPESSVHCCVTSPPYWSLRDYGVAGQIGLESTPEEYIAELVAVFREVRRVLRPDGCLWLNLGSCYASSRPARNASACDTDGIAPQDSQETDRACSHSDGGCLNDAQNHRGHSPHSGRQHHEAVSRPLRTGHGTERSGADSGIDVSVPPGARESTKPGSSPPPPGECSPDDSPQAYDDQIVSGSGAPDVQQFACTEPSTADSSSPSLPSDDRTSDTVASCMASPYSTIAPHKVKDLINIPFFVAEALRADGWYLRSAMPWVKRSPMPESCTDRPTSALEFVFLLTPSPKYYFDMEAVRIAGPTYTRKAGGYDHHHEQGASRFGGKGGFGDSDVTTTGRAFRNTDLYYASLKEPHGLICVGDEPVGLDVTSEAFKQAHFATFPRRLVEPMIKAGTSEKGCCPECGAGWVRVVDKQTRTTRPIPKVIRRDLSPGVMGDPGRHVTETRTVGWVPQCECLAHLAKADGVVTVDELNAWILKHPPDPCTVLDPFDGAGTTRLVAKQLGRRGIGIELNPEYAAMAEKRIANPEPLPEIPDVDGQLTFERM